MILFQFRKGRSQGRVPNRYCTALKVGTTNENQRQQLLLVPTIKQFLVILSRDTDFWCGAEKKCTLDMHEE